MPDINELMFRREHFPVTNPIVGIPPYHPSLLETGMDIELVSSVVGGALEETVLDLEELAEKRSDVKHYLERFKRDPITGKVEYRGVIQKTRGYDIIEPFPVWDSLFVSREQINPGDFFPSDYYLMIVKRSIPDLFYEPKNAPFSPALMEEYHMRVVHVSESRGRQIECPYAWYTHNVSEFMTIFYKNLAIAIDNAVVRKKYLK